MKVEFELTLDEKGLPVIKFRHYDKNTSLEQQTLKRFVELVKENGLQLDSPSGYIDTNGNSWESYEIRAKK